MTTIPFLNLHPLPKWKEPIDHLTESQLSKLFLIISLFAANFPLHDNGILYLWLAKELTQVSCVTAPQQENEELPRYALQF